MKALIERLKRPSLALKLCAAFLALVFGVVLIINIYPVALARDLVSANKRSSMLDQASLLSTSLGALETLTENGVYQAMELLDTSASYRIIVTDEKAEVLYDNYPVDSSVGKYAMLSEIYLALNSKVVFYSRYADEAFLSRAAMPVTSGGAVIGAVYLSEYDSEQSSLISGISSTMFRLSILLSLVSLVLILVFSGALTRRISDLVRAVNIVREGDYDYHIGVVGSDEVSALANEFNSMTDRLRETEERRRRFVSDASHELKTPLASIRLLSDSIMQTENMDTATMREFVSDIGAEAERLQRTTEKLLDLSRRDDGAHVKSVPVDVGGCAEDTLRRLAPLADKSSITLHCEAEPGCTILAPEDDVYQIVFNLAENAVKYNLPGGRVDVSVRRERGYVLLSVEDTGIGIPEEDLPNIFSRFYRVDKARSRERGGSGLGLSIVHDAVAAMGGKIDVHARESGGTRFTVTFPGYSGKEEAQ